MKLKKTIYILVPLALTLVCLFLIVRALQVPEKGTLREKFDKRYNAWQNAYAEWWNENPMSSMGPGYSLPEEQAILDMGPQVVPFLIEKIEKDLSDQRLYSPLQDNIRLIILITRKYFTKDEFPNRIDIFIPHHQWKLYVKWWKNRKRETPIKYARLYNEWDQLQKQNKTVEANVALGKLRNMGTEILPLLMEKIKNGDNRLVPFISELMGQRVGGLFPTRSSVLRWWDANKAHLTYPDSP